MSITNIGTTPLGAIILGGSGGNTGPLGPPAGVTGLTELEDYATKQGDTALVFADTLSYSNGDAVDLTGATVAFVMRNLANATPVILTGSGEIEDAESGQIAYYPSSSDTGTAGDFTACWLVTFRGGATMTFPTVGYIDVTIEPAIGTEPQLLVDLETVKNYPGINIQQNDRDLDARLTGFIQAARPLVERITGPIIPAVFDEKYAGGNNIISLSHRPSVGYGTSPVLNVMAVSEYVGPTEYPLANVASASLGTIWSYEVNTRLGTITRRTAGGGSIAFPAGENAVHVVYQAGQVTVPANVREATLEIVRVNFMTSQPLGVGAQTFADEEDRSSSPAFFMPRRALELLAPTRRGPSIA